MSHALTLTSKRVDESAGAKRRSCFYGMWSGNRICLYVNVSLVFIGLESLAYILVGRRHA